MKSRLSRFKLAFKLISLALITAMLVGCAYFNAFYNTKRNYKDGEREREQTTDLKAKPAGYGKAVDAGAKLIELYPGSRYIPETLFIMGQSYYWTEEYFKGKRKFEELLTNYPDYEKKLEARLWMGKTLVKMKKRQEATAILRGLIADTDDSEIISGAYFALAELYYVDEEYRKAEEGFLEITQTKVEDKVIGEAYYRAGDAAYKERLFEKSEDHFNQAIKHELTKTIQFQANLYLGRSYLENQKIDKAASVFRKLLKDRRYYEEHGQVKVLLAKCLVETGELEEASEDFRKISEEFKRNAEASWALYELARIQLRDPESRSLAKETLAEAKVAKAGSEYAKKADSLLVILDRVDDLGIKRLKTIDRISYTENFVSNPVEPADTLEFRACSYYDSLAIDSLQLIPLWSQAWRDSTVFPPEPEPDTLAVSDSTSSDSTNIESIKPDSTLTSVLADSLLTDSIPENKPPLLEEGLIPVADSLHKSENSPELDSLEFVIKDEDIQLIDSTGINKEIQADTTRIIPVAEDSVLAIDTVKVQKEENLVDIDESELQIINPDTTITVAGDSLRKQEDQDSLSILDESILSSQYQVNLADSSAQNLDTLATIADTIATISDSTGLSTGVVDSTIQEAEVIPPEPEIIHIFDLKPVLDSLAVMKVSLQDIRFQLGEIYLFDLLQPDSARVIFNELSNPPNADSVRARATLALAYISAKDSNFTVYDSLRNKIADDLATTNIGLEISKMLGRELPQRELSVVEQEFNEAERVLFAQDKNYEEANSRYRLIIERYPDSDYAPKAMFASAFITGRYLGDGIMAEELLNELQMQFPSSSQAMEAGRLLGDLQKIRQSETAGDSVVFEETEEELMAHAEDELDVVPELIGGHDALARIINAKNLLPPEMLEGTGGEVLLRYIVDEKGVASNFRILLEDPPGKGFARALLAALEEVNFRPGRLNEDAVSSRVERRYTLPLDAPPNVRPLPRRRNN